MTTKVYPAQRHGLDGWMLENAALAVVLSPAPGGKLLSLYDKRHGVEWLAPPVVPPAATLTYGAAWDGLGSYGWDEMMPTIVACPYPGPGDASGALLPDHGELWTEPWQAEARADAVTVHTAGRALPYRFARTATLAEPDTLVLDYTVENTGAEPLRYLWAAHPLFWCEPGAEIILPPAIDHVVNVLPAEWGAHWGEPGTLNPWPVKAGEDGPLFPGRVGGIERHAGRKFYAPPDRSVAWAGLWRPTVQCGLHMAWRAEDAPYLGLWVDEGAFYPGSSVVALEPTNGYYDSLALAAANNRVGKLAPHTMASWRLTVRVGAGQPPFSD